MEKMFAKIEDGMDEMLSLFPQDLRVEARKLLTRRPYGQDPVLTLAHRMVRYMWRYNTSRAAEPTGSHEDYVSVQVHHWRTNVQLELRIHRERSTGISCEIRSSQEGTSLSGPFRFRVTCWMKGVMPRRDTVLEQKMLRLGWRDVPAVGGSSIYCDGNMSQNT